jgi:hypothetical protein
VNFAQISDSLPSCPRAGILAVDVAPDLSASRGFRTRWYPRPDEAAARTERSVACVGKWETRMRFQSGWSLPGGNAWGLVLYPDPDPDLWEEWNDWVPEHYLLDVQDDRHRIAGHRPAGLDEHYGFEPAPGRSDDIEEYELLWSITFDNVADFAWGSNMVYVIIHRDDLAEARLDRAVVTGANY